MKVEEIERDKEYIDYMTLNLTRRILGNNLDQMGKKLFLGTYIANIGFYIKTWNSVNLRYLLAMLEYLGPEFSYNGNINIGKAIVADEQILEEIANGNYTLLDRLERETPAAFRKYGMLIGTGNF